MELTLNVYNDDGTIKKECKASTFDLKFGTIRKLMKLIDMDSIGDTVELLKVVYEAWEQITDILSECFPDIKDDEWDNIKVRELLPVLVGIVKSSFKEMLSIPNDSKNQMAG